MRSKKQWLREAKLYLILDAQVNSHKELLDILRKSVRAGVDIVQLRDKTGCARDILEFSRKAHTIINGKIPFVINDRVDLAMMARADGVHLGQEDVPIKTARRMVGQRVMIGVSCQTLAHARRAERDGADYIGFGSIFKTQTKPGRMPMDLKILHKVVREIKIPVFAIGGINEKNLTELVALGVKRVAVCRDVCLAKNVDQVTSRFKTMLLEGEVR